MQPHQWWQWAGALAITTLCVQYSVLIMALSANDKEKAHWNEPEVTAFIDYLYNHWPGAEIGDAGNFRLTTYNAAVDHIVPYHSSGPKKTGKMCKTKWSSVCYYCWLFIHTNWSVFLQIKHIYSAIENYQNQSGFHWDNICGAGIEGDTAEAVWTTYI